MIKLLLPLFIVVSLYSHENIYIFPDNHTRCIHEISDLIKKSSSVLIVSEHYHHPALSKALILSAKKGTQIKLILNDLQGEPLSLVQYRHISLYKTSAALKQSYILIDNTLLYTAKTAIDEDHFSRHHLTMQCSDSPQKMKMQHHFLSPILSSSHPYLE
ncbi:MAG: hypothetical protein CJD30_03135 [Sulfuricurvum sp. PD_MW2]|jgi:predicted transcriptional regulator|uniref:hypothetical protein n=1 Tax=Sulfuricurvum sp. PD_MW2 TaxID=2027917 RepID=UPI000C0632BB|nr:hypothetical protein [Sulfuricurvum sp. PD_MW2]PHM18190.1 MAG: hypothetical protein CJD30_03135 [Sulfuricurvum sp. PD_MW2]